MGEGVNLGSAYGSIQIDLSKLKTDLQAGGASLREFERSADSAAGQSARSFDKVKESATKAGLALAGIAAAGMALITSATMTAARTQVLGTVLHQVGKNAGYSASMLDAQVESIKKLGITTQEARTAVVRFIQSELDVAAAAKLARVAQDLAVIAGQNSSQAFTTLTQAIVSQETMLLRQYGIVKGLTEIYGDYAKANGLVASALDETQKKQAFLSAILEAGAKAAGTYEAAMGDAGKQMTSLPRYVEEAKNALGSVFLPMLGAVIKGVTGLLKAFIDLGPGMQTGIGVALAIGTALAAVGSTALLIVPKLIAAKNAFMALNTASAGMLGVVGAAALVVGAVISITAAVNAAHAAHRKESAELATTTTSYSAYRYKLEEAGIAAYGLTRDLYDLVQAQEEANRATFSQGLVEAKNALGGMVTLVEKYGKALDVSKITKLGLVVMQDAGFMAQLGTQLGYTGDALDEFIGKYKGLGEAETKRRQEAADDIRIMERRAEVYREVAEEMGRIKEQDGLIEHLAVTSAKEAAEAEALARETGALAKEIGLSVKVVSQLRDELHYTDAEVKAYADDLEITGGELDALAKSTGLTKDQIIRLNTEFGWGEKRILDYADALKEAEQAQLDLIGAWSEGLTGLADFQADVAASAKAYKDKLADLGKDTGSKLAEIKAKWKNALPDPTTVEQRLGMVQDAWDEWALRMGALMDGVQGDQEQGWMDTLRAMTDGTALSLQAAGGNIQTWLGNLKKAFYENKLPDLVGKDAPGYKEWADGVAADQKKATDAVNAEAGARRAALKKERDEELAAQKAHYAELLLQTALHIAEESGALATWAEKTQTGPYIEFYSNADNVFAAIKNGYLSLKDDPVLAQLIGTVIPGLGAAFEDAKKTAQENAIVSDDIISGAVMADLAAKQQEIVDSFKPENLNLKENIDIGLSDLRAGAAGEGLEGETWIDSVLGLNKIPEQAEKAFGAEGLSGKFTTAKDTTSADAKVMADAVTKAITSIPLDATPQFAALQTGWTTIIDAMTLKAIAFKDSVIAQLKAIVDFVNTLSVSATISWSATGGTGGFASGGVVPGAAGAPMAATVHGGEMILNQGQQQNLARMFGISQADIIRNLFGRGGGGSAAAPASRQLHTEFNQYFGDVIVRKPSEAREFGMDFSYGAKCRMRAAGLLEGR